MLGGRPLGVMVLHRWFWSVGEEEVGVFIWMTILADTSSHELLSKDTRKSGGMRGGRENIMKRKRKKCKVIYSAIHRRPDQQA